MPKRPPQAAHRLLAPRNLAGGLPSSAAITISCSALYSALRLTPMASLAGDVRSALTAESAARRETATPTSSRDANSKIAGLAFGSTKYFVNLMAI